VNHIVGIVLYEIKIELDLLDFTTIQLTMDSISTLILGISLMIIMFGMGLSLVGDDFKRVFVTPKAVLIGLLSQLILLPLIGFTFVYLFPLQPEIAIGVIILVACPGGATSNLVTHLAKGDIALSVSLTALSSLATLLTIPFIVNLGLKTVLGEETSIQLNIIQTIIQIFAIVIIPVGIGMIVRMKKEAFANRMESPMRTLSTIVFLLVLVGLLVKERANLISYFEQAGLIMLMLNLVTMSLGFILARIFNLSFKQGISISIESGIQNGTLGLVIATVLLGNTAYAVAPAIYSLIMFFTGGAVIFWSLRKQGKSVESIID
jgi:BASS family bile acid:Na+ symporter